MDEYQFPARYWIRISDA